MIESELEYAWAAGFIEADGCIHLDRSENGRAQVIVVQKDIRPLQRFQRIFGASTISLVTRRQTTATYYRLVYHSQRAVDVLTKILPYLDHKRAQADAALELLQRRIAYTRTYKRGYARKIDAAELAARMAIVDRVREVRHAERLSESAPAISRMVQ